MSLEVASVLVTGANRGIGLEFVRQLVKLPKPPRLVFATYRNEDTVQDLKSLQDVTKTSQIVLIKMDVTNSEEIESATKIVDDIVGEKGLTLLINNAGASEKQPFPEATDDNLRFHFNANTIGPINVLKAMFPLLQRSADANRGLKMGFSRAGVLNISSMGGSTSLLSADHPNKEFLAKFGYRISKTALNMAMRIVAIQYKDKGALVVQMCPGWVKTNMGTERAFLEVEDSVSKMLQTLPTLGESHHGYFFSNTGEKHPF